MNIVSIGGGPSGLYFGILMKMENPLNDITIVERNRPYDTFGWGVVFSDETMGVFEAADKESYDEIVRNFVHWDDIEIRWRGHRVISAGHGFAGLSRKKLLNILQERASSLGCKLVFETEVDSIEPYKEADLILAADGINSFTRGAYAEHFQPSLDWRRNKFIWLGTTKKLDTFLFSFHDTEWGIFQVHAYQFDQQHATWIVETTEETWRNAGLEKADEARTLEVCEKVFAPDLDGCPLLPNMAVWRTFPVVKNKHWHHDNVVLVGDAAHTAHFSIGSGTKLAMEDSIALRDAFRKHNDRDEALKAYETERRPAADSLQRAAGVSLEWFENVDRYIKQEPLQFAYSLLTRSLRINHDNLHVRDPKLSTEIDRWFTKQATGKDVAKPVPPLFTPYRVRGLHLVNRVGVSPMCMYSAEDGLIGDFHFVHLGARAIGGPAVVFTEMTCVSPEGRITHGCAGLYKPEHMEAWKRVVDFVHANSDAKMVLQLGHSGRKGATKLAWEGLDQPLESDAWEIIAPSPIPYLPHSQVPREMTRVDMDKVRDDFVRAAELGVAAGFDWLELHFAHGYLLASFISPVTNRRSDQYGGSLENRMRFPLEVFDAVRAVWPKDKPMSVRISAHDWIGGGITGDDAIEIATIMKAHDCDMISVSSGQTDPAEQPNYGRAFQTPFADAIRNDVGIGTLTVGNISSYGDVNAFIEAGRADMVLLARAHLYDPYWVRHAASELGYPLEWPDPYKSLARFNPRLK